MNAERPRLGGKIEIRPGGRHREVQFRIARAGVEEWRECHAGARADNLHAKSQIQRGRGAQVQIAGGTDADELLHFQRKRHARQAAKLRQVENERHMLVQGHRERQIQTKRLRADNRRVKANHGRGRRGRSRLEQRQAQCLLDEPIRRLNRIGLLILKLGHDPREPVRQPDKVGRALVDHGNLLVQQPHQGRPCRAASRRGALGLVQIIHRLIQRRDDVGESHVPEIGEIAELAGNHAQVRIHLQLTRRRRSRVDDPVVQPVETGQADAEPGLGNSAREKAGLRRQHQIHVDVALEAARHHVANRPALEMADQRGQ